MKKIRLDHFELEEALQDLMLERKKVRMLQRKLQEIGMDRNRLKEELCEAMDSQDLTGISFLTNESQVDEIQQIKKKIKTLQQWVNSQKVASQENIQDNTSSAKAFVDPETWKLLPVGNERLKQDSVDIEKKRIETSKMQEIKEELETLSGNFQLVQKQLLEQKKINQQIEKEKENIRVKAHAWMLSSQKGEERLKNLEVNLGQAQICIENYQAHIKRLELSRKGSSDIKLLKDFSLVKDQKRYKKIVSQLLASFLSVRNLFSINIVCSSVKNEEEKINLHQKLKATVKNALEFSNKSQSLLKSLSDQIYAHLPSTASAVTLRQSIENAFYYFKEQILYIFNLIEAIETSFDKMLETDRIKIANLLQRSSKSKIPSKDHFLMSFTPSWDFKKEEKLSQKLAVVLEQVYFHYKKQLYYSQKWQSKCIELQEKQAILEKDFTELEKENVFFEAPTLKEESLNKGSDQSKKEILQLEEQLNQSIVLQDILKKQHEDDIVHWSEKNKNLEHEYQFLIQEKNRQEEEKKSYLNLCHCLESQIETEKVKYEKKIQEIELEKEKLFKKNQDLEINLGHQKNLEEEHQKVCQELNETHERYTKVFSEHLLIQEKCQSLIQEKKRVEEEKNSFEKKYQGLLESYSSFKDRCSILEEESIELEKNLQIAQNHVAKKIRENALLEQQIQRQQGLIDQLEEGMKQSYVKLEALQIKEKKLTIQFQESLAEEKKEIQTWKSRCDDLTDKLRYAQKQVVDFEKMQTEHAQMKEMVCQIQKIFYTPMPGLAHSSIASAGLYKKLNQGLVETASDSDGIEE